MKVTTQQKILGGVLLVGAIAIGLDQFVFRAAPANATPDAGTEYAVATTSTKTDAAIAVPTISVSQRLRNAAKSGSDNTLHDAFAMGPSWQPAAAVEQQPVEKTVSADAFRQSHHLTGVITSNGRALAMVDGKIVTVGQVVDGFKLTSISNGNAVFVVGKARVVLSTNEGGAMAGVGQ